MRRIVFLGLILFAGCSDSSPDVPIPAAPLPFDPPPIRVRAVPRDLIPRPPLPFLLDSAFAFYCPEVAPGAFRLLPDPVGETWLLGPARVLVPLLLGQGRAREALDLLDVCRAEYDDAGEYGHLLFRAAVGALEFDRAGEVLVHMLRIRRGALLVPTVAEDGFEGLTEDAEFAQAYDGAQVAELVGDAATALGGYCRAWAASDGDHPRWAADSVRRKVAYLSRVPGAIDRALAADATPRDRAELLSRVGRFEEAAEAWDACLREGDPGPARLFDAALAYRTAGRSDRARDLFVELSLRGPDDPWALAALRLGGEEWADAPAASHAAAGRVLLLRGLAEEARRELESAKGDPRALDDLSVVTERAGEWGREPLLFARLAWLRARAAEERGDDAAVVVWLERAVACYPWHVDAAIRLADRIGRRDPPRAVLLRRLAAQELARQCRLEPANPEPAAALAAIDVR